MCEFNGEFLDHLFLHNQVTWQLWTLVLHIFEEQGQIRDIPSLSCLLFEARAGQNPGGFRLQQWCDRDD